MTNLRHTTAAIMMALFGVGLVPSAARAQSPSTVSPQQPSRPAGRDDGTAAPSPPGTKQGTTATPDAPSSSSNELSHSRGVIAPPPTGDRGIMPPPSSGTQSTPVIPPPGTPGGNPKVEPK